MTKQEAIKYGIKIMHVFPDDIHANDAAKVLTLLLEAAQKTLKADSPDAEEIKMCICPPMYSKCNICAKPFRRR